MKRRLLLKRNPYSTQGETCGNDAETPKIAASLCYALESIDAMKQPKPTLISARNTCLNEAY